MGGRARSNRAVALENTWRGALDGRRPRVTGRPVFDIISLVHVALEAGHQPSAPPSLTRPQSATANCSVAASGPLRYKGGAHEVPCPRRAAPVRPGRQPRPVHRRRRSASSGAWPSCLGTARPPSALTRSPASRRRHRHGRRDGGPPAGRGGGHRRPRYDAGRARARQHRLLLRHHPGADRRLARSRLQLPSNHPGGPEHHRFPTGTNTGCAEMTSISWRGLVRAPLLMAVLALVLVEAPDASLRIVWRFTVLSWDSPAAPGHGRAVLRNVIASAVATGQAIT